MKNKEKRSLIKRKIRKNRKGKYIGENVFFRSYCNTLFKFKNYIMIIIISFIISLIIIYFTYFNLKKSKKKKKVIYSTNSTFNKGFLDINTTHKGKFKYYNYASNIKVYKDLYKDISYVPLTDSNSILPSKQIAKEEFTKLCREGILLDKTKYKRNKNPKISVVIPYYIQSNLSITLALRSIQNQSFKDIEIIIVDDGSIEEKVTEIFEAMKDENRIIFLRHKERKSTLLARVDGIRFASGEYIIQVDQDDNYLNNLLFEKLYNKSKELDVDMIQFTFCSNDNPEIIKPEYIPIAKNVIIKQPDLRTAFLLKGGDNRLQSCASRMIWDTFVRRTTYLEGIEDLGDEYMNHRFRLYEDTIMKFELSQVAYSYYFYDIEGLRHGKKPFSLKDKNKTVESQILAKNQLLFIKLLLYKIDPKYDRNHIYSELGFGRCDHNAKDLSREDFDLGLEVVEAVFELERIYKNTSPQLINCINKIKTYFET